jgi:hypothetical protein
MIKRMSQVNRGSMQPSTSGRGLCLSWGVFPLLPSDIASNQEDRLR